MPHVASCERRPPPMSFCGMFTTPRFRFWPPPRPLLGMDQSRDWWFAVNAPTPRKRTLQQSDLLSERIFLLRPLLLLHVFVWNVCLSDHRRLLRSVIFVRTAVICVRAACSDASFLHSARASARFKSAVTRILSATASLFLWTLTWLHMPHGQQARLDSDM